MATEKLAEGNPCNFAADAVKLEKLIEALKVILGVRFTCIAENGLQKTGVGDFIAAGAF